MEIKDFKRIVELMKNNDLTEFSMKDDEFELAMKRGADPREVSDVMVFCASDAASYLTGQIIAVDGGWTAI